MARAKGVAVKPIIDVEDVIDGDTPRLREVPAGVAAGDVVHLGVLRAVDGRGGAGGGNEADDEEQDSGDDQEEGEHGAVRGTVSATARVTGGKGAVLRGGRGR